MRPSPSPAEPRQKKKLRWKDIWVEQTHPNAAPRIEQGATPAGRLAVKAPNQS